MFQDDGRGSQQGGSQSGDSSTTGVILKAIYRFGNTYHVSLQSGDGGAVQQFEWQQGQGQAPSFNGYQIQVVDTRNVTFSMPPGMSCQPNPQFGGNCVGRNQMSVTFAQTEPRRNNQQQRTNNNNNNNNNNRNNTNQQWFSENGNDPRAALFEAARANPNGPERQQLEALIRAERGGGRGNTNNNNTNGRGGRGGGGGGGGGGGFNGNTNNNNGGNTTGGRGGGGGGRGGGGFGN